MGAKLLHADRQLERRIDITKLTVASEAALKLCRYILHNFIHTIFTFLLQIQIFALNTLNLLSSLREKKSHFTTTKGVGETMIFSDFFLSLVYKVIPLEL